MLVNSGRDKCALQLAGGTQAGFKGTTTGITSTTVTDSGAAFTTAGTGLKGKIVIVDNAYGVIVSNTATVLTIDRFYDPTNPTGTAATAPTSPKTYVVLGGSAPVFYTAISADGTAPAATDTALTGEITTAGGGLIRKASTYAHTAGANTYTLTTTYTANGSDSLPVTVAKMGTFDCLTGASGLLFHESAVSPTATLSASGDQLTLTQTVTLT